MSQPQPSVTTEQLRSKRCVACEGGVPKIDREQAAGMMSAIEQWSLADDGGMISRKINAGNFVKAVACIEKIAAVAEEEQHHPDLHLTGYRHLRIDVTTHAIGGLSENDFILAAKIDGVLE